MKRKIIQVTTGTKIVRLKGEIDASEAAFMLMLCDDATLWERLWYPETEQWSEPKPLSTPNMEILG